MKKKYILDSEYSKTKAKELIDWAIEKKGYYIEISKHSKNRTIIQNKLYWYWLTIIEKDTGNEKEYLHDFFRDAFLKRVCVVVKGQEIDTPMSTTKLDTKNFFDYLERIRIWSSTELGITLPSREDIALEEYNSVGRFK